VFRLDELENSGIDIEAEEIVCKQAIAKVREKEHELTYVYWLTGAA